MSQEFRKVFPHLLRPLGLGIATFSAKPQGFVTQVAPLWKKAYGTVDPELVKRRWLESMEKLKKAKVVVLGVPSDVGAGIRKGAAHGPLGVRLALYRNKEFQRWMKHGWVVDLGDVFTNPQLLHDEMLSSAQLERCREQMYPKASPSVRRKLAVSPLSQTKQILSALLQDFPKIKPLVLGGDHSVAWPVTEVLSGVYSSQKKLGIVQMDAHTDLLPVRLGVKYCFGTWSYHANELLGRGGRMVQVGIRNSGRDKKHWESQLSVKQVWAKEVTPATEKTKIREIITHLKARGVNAIYFTNDVDGTDAKEVSATGTPEPQGLRSGFVKQLIERLGEAFGFVGADIMEVAPHLGSPKGAQKTCKIASDYAVAEMRQLLR